MSSKRVGVIVVILLVLTGTGLLVLAIQSVRNQARRTELSENLKKVLLAMHSCAEAHKVLPPAFNSYGDVEYPASVHVHLLAFIEAPVYQPFLKKGQGDPSATIPAYYSYLDPSMQQPDGVQNFAANLRVFTDKGVHTKFDKDMPALAEREMCGTALSRSFANGTSNTIAFATKFAVCGDGGSRYASDLLSPFGAFFGQRAARDLADASNPQATFQLAPPVDECLPRPFRRRVFRKKISW